MKEFIHIGFPKTASTTLQEHVFAKTPAIENVGRPFDNPDDAQLLNGLALDDDRDFREEEMVARVAAGRERGAPVLVYSGETVVNTPIRSIAAKRLKHLMPDAHIIAVVRNQFDALTSNYVGQARHVRRAPEPYAGRHVSFENFLAFQFKNTKQGVLPTFDYADVLDIYADLFGPDHEHVLLYETLRQREADFVGQLAQILDIDADRIPAPSAAARESLRPDAGQVRYQALRTRFLRGVPLSRMVPGAPALKRGAQKLLGSGGLDTDLTPSWRSQIVEYYRANNQRLARDQGLDLAAHGYPL